MKNYNISIDVTKLKVFLVAISKQALAVALFSMATVVPLTAYATNNTLTDTANLVNTAANEVTPAPCCHQDLGPWSVMFYRGNTAKQVFGEAIIGKYNSFGESIYALELAYTLDQKNIVRRFFRPVFDVVQVAGNLAYRHDYKRHDNVKEGNLYLTWRFTRFPWSNYLRNSIAIGDGLSYASHPPFADVEEGKLPEDFSRLLNYLMMEVTFSLPAYPQFELAIRAHHRCTAWGTFSGNANAGSTNVGLGLRYYF